MEEVFVFSKYSNCLLLFKCTNTLQYTQQDAILAKPDGNHLRGYMVPYITTDNKSHDHS